MALSRRQFIQNTVLGSAAIVTGCNSKGKSTESTLIKHPISISTWNHGIVSNEEAMKILSNGGRALDAVEAGVKTAEANPDGLSV